MTHIVHPYAHRLGIVRDWKSRWFGAGRAYTELLRSDVLVREFLAERLRGYLVASVEIERGPKLFRIVVKTARPGLLIGRSGEGVNKLRADLLSFLRRERISLGGELKLDVEEVRSPESNASIVAQMIAETLERRFPFRRVMKQTIDKVMANRDVKGVKIYLGGRLGGAEMARSEEHKRGRIPLQTIRADVDFARERAHMSYGDIGVKVWIYKGEIFADKNKQSRR